MLKVSLHVPKYSLETFPYFSYYPRDSAYTVWYAVDLDLWALGSWNSMNEIRSKNLSEQSIPGHQLIYESLALQDIAKSSPQMFLVYQIPNEKILAQELFYYWLAVLVWINLSECLRLHLENGANKSHSTSQHYLKMYYGNLHKWSLKISKGKKLEG